MRSLQSINNARAEARYVSRTWKNDSTTDVAGHVHFDTPKTPQPDDIIKVWVANPEKAGWLMAVEITRAQHEAKIKAMNEALDAKWRAEGRIK